MTLANAERALVRTGLSAALLVAGLVIGCQAVTGVVPPAAMKLDAQNGTTKALVLIVNGSATKDLDPGSQVEITADVLPPLPWTAEVRLPDGRSLVSLTVRAGDVVNTPGSQRGDAARIDLSCGRVDLWSGPPLLGPAPQPGIPGDCDP